MSYSEILETSDDGRFRVVMIADEYADEPYDDGQSPLLRLDRTGYGVRAEHVMATGRPLGDDARIEDAAQQWHATPSGGNWRLFEKYLRAYHGATKVETWCSGDYWYVTYDPAWWREWAGAPEGSADMSEYRAWCEGDVWGWVVEKRVTWHAEDSAYDDRDSWEHVDSCFGYYGSDGANGKDLEDCAREALAYADEPYAHMAGAHEIRPDLLTRWDRETITRKHAQQHQAAWADKLGHRHDDPHAPFAVAAEAAS